MNVEFKVGDKLRFIGRSREWYTKDAVYEVASIEEDEGVIWIVIHDNKGLYRGWKPADIPEFFRRIDEQQADQSESQPQVVKVKLTQEQAESVKELLDIYGQEDALVMFATGRDLSNSIGYKKAASLSEVTAIEFATALLIGYDVEETPEERVLKAWEINNPEKYENPLFFKGCRQGMKFALNAYDIKIKGIND